MIILFRLKIIFLIFIFFVQNFVHGKRVDPLSKITVKSQSAIFQKDKKNPELVYLKYKERVVVNFADGTTIKSENLKIFLRTKNLKNLKNGSRSEVEKIIFEKNVKINRKTQKIEANNVEIVIPERTCKLVGNVKVEQIKQEKKSNIPITAECQRANLNWDDDEIVLFGNEEKPVITTIELDGKVKFFRKKDLQDKKK